MSNKETLKEMCERANVDYNKALEIKENNPSLTDEQIITHHLRPDCYVNIFGDLIVPDEK